MKYITNQALIALQIPELTLMADRAEAISNTADKLAEWARETDEGDAQTIAGITMAVCQAQVHAREAWEDVATLAVTSLNREMSRPPSATP